MVSLPSPSSNPNIANIILVDNFVAMLIEFPDDAPLIADSVYANSELMDGRRFADEFLRRRTLAKKGVVESASSMGFSTVGASSNAGGWSEVAKKGPPKVEEPAAAGFKVVPGKKKARK
jgi:PERQ amino acid-rich with GYF domain-containing protein